MMGGVNVRCKYCHQLPKGIVRLFLPFRGENIFPPEIKVIDFLVFL